MSFTSRSWLSIATHSPFSLNNIPFGIISTTTTENRRVGVAIGDYVLDLEAFAKGNGFSQLPIIQNNLGVFSQTTLNAFAALGQPAHKEVRKYIQRVFTNGSPLSEVLQNNQSLKEAALLPLSDVKTYLPMAIGDYTDFYAGLNHAYTVGTLIRGKDNALQPNYKHIPVAYHSRASSVVVSGTPIRRPLGQTRSNPTATTPTFGPSKRLDIELELGVFICKENKLGEPIPISEARDYIFGFVLMNDWSARDIQTWEYVPLGPFNAKNFGTTISPWVVLYEALEPYMTHGLFNDVEVQKYLRDDCKTTFPDIHLQVDLTSKYQHKTTLTQVNASNLLWSFPQMIAHHTISGCPMRVGDLLGSGTISGPDAGTQGSLLEASHGGMIPFQLNGGESRLFLDDGDEIQITGFAGTEQDGFIGFGTCTGKIEPALQMEAQD